MLSPTTMLLFLFGMLSVVKYHNELESHAKFTISAPLASTPVWAQDYSSSEELITEFCRECRIVRKGNLSDPFLSFFYSSIILFAITSSLSYYTLRECQ